MYRVVLITTNLKTGDTTREIVNTCAYTHLVKCYIDGVRKAANSKCYSYCNTIEIDEDFFFSCVCRCKYSDQENEGTRYTYFLEEF